MKPPLQGCRIVVTRAPEQADDLLERLEALGARVLLFPTVAIRAVDPPPVCDLAGYHWAVFASTNAVRFFFNAYGDMTQPVGLRVAAVGSVTAEALRARGWHACVVPASFVAEVLLDSLLTAEPDVRGKRFVLPRGNLGRDVVASGLRAHGAEVDELILYQNVCPEVTPRDRVRFDVFDPHLVVFTSPSTAVNFAAIVGKTGLELLNTSCHFASIGPVTSQAAGECGMPILIEPAVHTISGLVEAIAQRWPKGGDAVR